LNNGNNHVELCGEIVSKFTYSHEYKGEKFYTFDLVVRRKSGVFDSIPVIASGYLLDEIDDRQGYYMRIYGDFRSFRNPNNKHCMMYVFAKELEYVNKNTEINGFTATGFLCRKKEIRRAKERTIVDFMVAINRNYYGKADYIPCIAWNRHATAISKLEKGTLIKVNGRIQSREYAKRLDDGTFEIRTAYEVSISSFNEIMTESEVS
jgi:hypothetical protein